MPTKTTINVEPNTNPVIITSFQLREDQFGKKRFYPTDNTGHVYLHGLNYDDKEKLVRVKIQGCTTIPENAFRECTNLINVEMDDTVISLGKAAFHSCTSLAMVQLSMNLTSIPEYAFYNCSGLFAMGMGNEVLSIGDGAYSGCEKMILVKLSRRLKKIGKRGFSKCFSLRSLYIPISCDEIEDEAFLGCSSLSILHIPSQATVGRNVVVGCRAMLSNSPFQGMKIKKDESNREDHHEVMNQWLKSRFSNLPLHILCYYIDSPGRALEFTTCLPDAIDKMDYLGMTPLHILAANPFAPTDAIQVVVGSIIGNVDSFDTSFLITRRNDGMLPFHILSSCFAAPDEAIIAVYDLTVKLMQGNVTEIVYLEMYGYKYTILHHLIYKGRMTSQLLAKFASIRIGSDILATINDSKNISPTKSIIEKNLPLEIMVELFSIAPISVESFSGHAEVKYLQNFHKVVKKYIESIMNELGNLNSPYELRLSDAQKSALVKHISITNDAETIDLWLKFINDHSRFSNDAVKNFGRIRGSNGKVLLEVAPVRIREAIQARSLFMGRYDIMNTPPLHLSSTSKVVRAVDTKPQEHYKNLCPPTGLFQDQFFSILRDIMDASNAYAIENFLKYSKNRMTVDRDSFIKVCEDLHGDNPMVVIKWMKNKDEFEKEKYSRVVLKSVGSTLVRLWEAYDPEGANENDRKFAQEYRQYSDEYSYAIVMPFGDRNLDAIFRYEQPNEIGVRSILDQLCNCLLNLHTQGMIHGDLRMMNIVRFEGRKYLLIDMDASSSFRPSQALSFPSYNGSKISSGVLPPEMIHCFKNKNEILMFEKYYYEEMSVFKEDLFYSQPWTKIRYQHYGDKVYAAKSFSTEKQSRTAHVQCDLPYELLQPHPAQDLWALGVLLFALVTGESLFNVDRNDDLISGEEYHKLATWSDESRDAILEQKLEQGKNSFKNLIRQLLSKTPEQRGSIVDIQGLLKEIHIDIPSRPLVEVQVRNQEYDEMFDASIQSNLDLTSVDVGAVSLDVFSTAGHNRSSGNSNVIVDSLTNVSKTFTKTNDRSIDEISTAMSLTKLKQTKRLGPSSNGATSKVVSKSDLSIAAVSTSPVPIEDLLTQAQNTFSPNEMRFPDTITCSSWSVQLEQKIDVKTKKKLQKRCAVCKKKSTWFCSLDNFFICPPIASANCFPMHLVKKHPEMLRKAIQERDIIENLMLKKTANGQDLIDNLSLEEIQQILLLKKRKL